MSAPKKHAKFSASSSHRWMHCPGSIALSEKAPPQRESEYAKEGTDAHTCVEMLLKNPHKQLATEDMLRRKHGAQMVSHAATAVKEILRRKPKGAELYCETKVDLSFIDPQMFGTADAVIAEPFGRLTVIDFKYGAGVIVDPENNSQMAFYALGVAHAQDYNFSEVAMVILQPRAASERGWVREWVIPMDELISWGEKFKEAAMAAKQANAKLCAGDWCRWCPAAVLCPEISGRALQQAQIEFAPESGQLAVVDADQLSPENLSRALNAFEKIEFWIAQVRAFAHQKVERGGGLPGWKLVGKRATRKWIDAEKAAKEAFKIFREDAFTMPDLLSPAQLEKLGPDAARFVEKRCQAISSGLTLVPDSDPRPAVNQIESDFGDVGIDDLLGIDPPLGNEHPRCKSSLIPITHEKGETMATKKLVAKKPATKKKLTKKKTSKK